MSTRYARTADKAQNEKNSTILKGLLKQPGNKFCADCKRKDPRWASWNLGIFVCIRCSGIHRSMGTHISKVKSVDLDSWIPSQVENMEKWGNERANLYWEANLKDNRPNESNMDMWIRSKYDMKRWAMKGPIPDPDTLNGGSPSVSVQQQAPSSAPKPKTSAPHKTETKRSEFNSLDDFFGSSPSNSTTTTNMSNSNNAQQQFQGNDIFASMDSSSAAPQPKEQPKPQIDFKSSILSLYNKQPQTAGISSSPSSFMNNGGNVSAGGNYHQQLSGLGGGFSSMGATNTQSAVPDNGNNGWGSFVSSSAPATNSLTSQVSQGQIFGGTSFQQQQQQHQPKKQVYDAFADLLN